MDILNRWILISSLVIQPGLCLSADSINVVLMPDSFNSFKCHQPGIEFQITQNSIIGVVGILDCESDRSTYGDTNDDVTNDFSRIFVPWRYSKDGAIKDGSFVQALVGIENSKFSSTLGSKAEVTYIDFAVHYGYQWFWKSGFNVSALAGLAYLVKTRSTEDIAPTESSDVIEFLDKNTKTNIHGGAGFMLGWKY